MKKYLVGILIVLTLFFLIFGCETNLEEKSKKERKSECFCMIDTASITLKLYPYNNLGSVFYYPMEIYIEIKIENKSDKSIHLKKLDSSIVISRKYYSYICCVYKNRIFNVYCIKDKDSILIKPKEEYYLSGYLIEFPLYDSLYSYTEFDNFMQDFSRNVKFRFDDFDSTKNLSVNHLKINSFYDGDIIKLINIGYPDSLDIENKEVFTVSIGEY